MKFFRTVKLLSRDALERVFEMMKLNWNLYYVDGDKDVECGVMYDFVDWFMDEFCEVLINFKVKDSAAYEAFDVIYSEFEWLNVDRINVRVDVGLVFSVLLVWEKVKEEGLFLFIIVMLDVYINFYCGFSFEFDFFILSFLFCGLKKWDVLFFDCGECGVNEDNLCYFEVLFSNKVWEKFYVFYKNIATIVGEALSSNFYMVFKLFMDGIFVYLKVILFINVDWWINCLCENGDLECFLYNVENWYDGLTSERKVKMGESYVCVFIVDMMLKVDVILVVVESVENVIVSVVDVSVELVKES